MPWHTTPIALTPQDEAHFWSRVDRSGGPTSCWPWTGSRSHGYGHVGLGGKVVRAHRVAWTLANGPIPPRLLVCHTCDNPPCCNPLHLFVGTATDNARDREAKGRRVPISGPAHYMIAHPELRKRGDDHWSRRMPERRAFGDRNGTRTHPERVPRGEGNGMAKLTHTAVLEIRARYVRRKVTYKMLAAEFGVSWQAVMNVVKGHSWQ